MDANKLGEAYYRLGEVYRNGKDPGTAETAYKKCMEYETPYAYLARYQLADAALKTIWDELQSHSQYRGTTTLIVTTDHGRGNPPQDWRGHGEAIAGSDATWLAVLGPDTRALGERSGCVAVTQSEVAATLAALLGEDYKAEAPKAATPIAEVLPNRRVGNGAPP